MPSSDRDNQVDKALSRIADIDSLVLRPKLASIEETLDSQVTSERRITLLEHQELEQKIKHAPAEPEPYVQLAKIYQNQKRWKDAIRVLDAGVHNNPDYEPLVRLREDYLIESAEKLAKEAKTTYLNQPSKDTELYLRGAETNLAQETIRFCQGRAKRHPEQRELLVRWAAALQSLKNYEEAIPLLEQVLELPELRAEAALRLGECYEAVNRPLESLSHYRIAGCFRMPPPPSEIQQRAFQAGLKLAEKLHLSDTASHFRELLQQLNKIKQT